MAALIFLGVGALLSAFSPPERSLGPVYRIVMFHGGMAVVAFATLAVAAGVGLFSLVRPSRASDAWTAAGQESAAFVFLLYFASSYVAMIKAWFGPLLEEPRFEAAVRVLVVGGIAFAVSLAVHRPRVRAALSVLVGVYALYLLAVTPLFFHPKNPVRTSDVVAARLFFYGIVASLGAFSASFWGWRLARWRAHHRSGVD